MATRMRRNSNISWNHCPPRKHAAALLAVMVVSGLACPCRGLIPLAEWTVKNSQAQACEVSSCCPCCPVEQTKKSNPEPMHDCSCLSGCCDPYIAPVVETIYRQPADLVFAFSPVLPQTESDRSSTTMIRRGITDPDPPLFPIGTHLPTLSALLI